MVAIAEIPSWNGGGASAKECTSCSPSGQCGNGLEKVYPTCAVRYGYMNHIGEFRYAPGMLFGCGQKVVIQTDRGTELGQQVSLTCTGCSKSISRDQIKTYVKNSGPDFMRLHAGRILRAATPVDLEEDTHQTQLADEMLRECKQIVLKLDMPMKMVTCEYLLGGERTVFYFMSEIRVDFRELVRELAHLYHTRIEMRQVGARDEARLVADYEICGRECCCKNFLKTLRPVTMRMAKLQKATLDPSKVSGRCGRLRCCLRYEHESYEELNRKLPRVGRRVTTEGGPGVVIDRQILTQLVLVEYEDGRRVTIPLEELRPVEGELPAQARQDPAVAADEDTAEHGDLPHARIDDSQAVDDHPLAIAEGSAPATGVAPAGGPPRDGLRPGRGRRRRRRRGGGRGPGGSPDSGANAGGAAGEPGGSSPAPGE